MREIELDKECQKLGLILEAFKTYSLIFIVMIGVLTFACLIIMLTALAVEMIKDLKRR